MLDSSVSTGYDGKVPSVMFKSQAKQPEKQFQWQWQILHTILDTHNYACFTTDSHLMHHYDTLYLKLLDKFHDRVSQIKMKNVHIKNISGNEWHLSWNERLQSTINTLTMQYFTHKWRCTFTLHVPSLITVEFLLFMNIQITKNAKSDLHLHQCTKGHVRSRSVAVFPRCRR